jgi:hypothetical protein
VLLSAFAIVVLVFVLIVTVMAIEWCRRPTYHASADIQIIGDDDRQEDKEPGRPSS